jgi:CRP-like cAMP-binding protein
MHTSVELPAAARRNRLLANLPEADFERLLPNLELVGLALKEALYDANRPIRHVHFVLCGVVSLVTTLEGGAIVETGLVGNEGMVGLPAFLGAMTSPVTAFCQVPGLALRIDAAALREEARGGVALVGVLHRYTQAFLTQLSQSVACNRMHGLRERCARWLLMTHDRAGTDEFSLTHEFLSQMLGVRRAGVTEVLRELRAAGLVRYRQRRLAVVDRPGLEAASCRCYRTIRAEYDRLVG